MIKKIKDLTLEEVSKICDKCDVERECPFINVYIVDCQSLKKLRRSGFNERIEIKDGK